MDDQLQQALQENRLQVVRRVLQKKGYRVDSEESLAAHQMAGFDSLEQQLICQGNAQPLGFWRRLWRWLTRVKHPG
ncbi:MAG: hypothetical protein KZQ58_05580 [gamma proteobacterium symbiont of Bathyaustriella thionipta]|nr:hypothetical protein [gamma proteobacterium symbiont of Bathyaustriella thionipta]